MLLPWVLFSIEHPVVPRPGSIPQKTLFQNKYHQRTIPSGVARHQERPPSNQTLLRLRPNRALPGKLARDLARLATTPFVSPSQSPPGIPTPKNHASPASSPELALGADIVLGPQLHAVHRGLGILLRGQVAAHHLVLVVLESSLRANTTSGVLRPRHLLLLASPPGAMAAPGTVPSSATHAPGSASLRLAY